MNLARRQTDNQCICTLAAPLRSALFLRSAQTAVYVKAPYQNGSVGHIQK